MSTANLTRIEDGPVATVYSGHHKGAPVALKVFPKRFDKRTMAAFTKEQSRLAAVRRITSILMVDGVDELPSGEPALRMELCTQSLSALVEKVGPLAAQDVIVLGRAVALGLAAAHSAGVVHGGIAPNNVLFRNTGEPVVSDFGVTLRQAIARDPLHAIEYLPPETLRTGTLNESTDLYGLGAVLHFALSARSPHPGRLGEQPGERVLRILGEPVPAINRPDVPIGLSTLVARLLASTPDRRPSEAAVVADQLTSMLPNPPKAATRDDFDDFDGAPPPPPRPAQPPRHQPPADDDFDDFAPQYPHRPGPPPRPVPAEHAVWMRPRPPQNPGPAAPPTQELHLPTAPPPQAVTPTPAIPPIATPAEPRTPQPESPMPQESADAGESQPMAAASEPVVAPQKPGLAAPELMTAAPVEAPLPLAALTPAPPEGVLLPEAAPTEAFPAPPTVEFASSRPGVVLENRRPLDFDDDFGDFADAGPGRAKVLAGPLAPPGQAPKRLIRYDILAGAALLLALLALVPLLLLRGDPDELSSSTHLPNTVGGSGAGEPKVELAEPTDLTTKVELAWTASQDFDFAVFVAEEGQENKVFLAERNHSMTVPVAPGRKYCFMVQATDGDDVYESNFVPLRGASCKK